MKKILFIFSICIFALATQVSAQAQNNTCSIDVIKTNIIGKEGSKAELLYQSPVFAYAEITDGNKKGLSIDTLTLTAGSVLIDLTEVGKYTVVLKSRSNPSNCTPSKPITITVTPASSCSGLSLKTPSIAYTNKPFTISWSSVLDNVDLNIKASTTRGNILFNENGVDAKGAKDNLTVPTSTIVTVKAVGYKKNTLTKLCEVVKTFKVTKNPQVYAKEDVSCAQDKIEKYFMYAAGRRALLALAGGVNIRQYYKGKFDPFFKSYKEDTMTKSIANRQLMDIYKAVDEDAGSMFREYSKDIKAANKSLKKAVNSSDDPGILSDNVGRRLSNGTGCNLKGFPVPTLY